MLINNALSVGTVVKLKESEKRVVIMGIMQQVETENGVEKFDYVAVPYPEGFLGPDSTLLFQETDIESVFSLGYSDIERQSFIAMVAEKMQEDELKKNTLEEGFR